MTMVKVKSIFLNVSGKLKEQNRIAKIICFFIGFCFNILGIVCVLIWKYVFCSNSEKTKYCTRVSILGMVANWVIFCKFFSFLLFKNFFKEPKNVQKYPVVINSNFFGIDDFFEREMIKMNNVFEENQKMMNKMFVEENKNDDKNNFKKEVKDLGNGFQETVIETSTPNSYEKVIKTEYVGDNSQNNVKKVDNVKKNEKLQQVKMKNVEKKIVKKDNNDGGKKKKSKKSCDKKCNNK